MRFIFLILIFLANGAPAGEENPYVQLASAEERQVIMDALAAAYDATDKALLKNKDKTILIKEVDGKIMVSFLNYEHENKYGGQAHVTYDPAAKKVVMVEAED